MLYHEKQVAALCGVHCLNTLLQGPYFSEVDLAQMAQELDAMERAMLSEGGASGEAGNLDDSGMFSIQVLHRALQVWELQAIPYDSSEVRCPGWDPLTEAAFICNLQEHWFTIRRIAPHGWWNLNSLFPAPEALSDFYLAAFLDSLRDQGYTIFVVRGPLPARQLEAGGDLEGPGSWFSPEDARAAQAEAANARARGRVANALEGVFARAGAAGGALTLRSSAVREDDAHDSELAAAIAASLGQQPSSSSGQPPAMSYAAAAAGAASGGGGIGAGSDSSAGQWQGAGGDFGDFGEDEDPELAMALAASMADMQPQHQAQQQQQPAEQSQPAAQQQSQAAAREQTPPPSSPAPLPDVPDEPEEGPGVLSLALRLPSGQRVSRRFTADATVGQLHAFACSAAGGVRGIVLSTQFPKRVLQDMAATLSQAGLADREMLTATET